MERKEEKWKGGKIREMEKRIEGIEGEGREEMGGKWREEKKGEGSIGERGKGREVEGREERGGKCREGKDTWKG